MTSPATGSPLLQRSYLAEDQSRFAELSGDGNPVHLDPIVARRTLFGTTVVHGLHLVLTVLEAVWAKRQATPGPPEGVKTLTAKFPRPVAVGEEVRFLLADQTEDTCLITGEVQGDVVLQVHITFSAPPFPIAERALPEVPREPLVTSDFAALTTAEGDLPLGLNRPLAAQLFPVLTTALGPLAVSELLALTRLVGMRCPGLHSIFGEFDIRFQRQNAAHLHYRVRTADPRFRRLRMEVAGSCIAGHIIALVRPAPAQQMAMAEIMNATPRGAYAGSVALVVGGSRGLGELTAKILAAGGGFPILTYFRGQRDAERVVEEIRHAGGQCEASQLDIRSDQAAIGPLFDRPKPPRSIYYFSTPKIFARRRGFFDQAVLEEFNAYYVGAFGRLLDKAAAHTREKLRIFYPSSVAVERHDRDAAEYAIAKRAGEALCSYYNQYSAQVEILVERLPRLKTDQTLGVLDTPADEAFEIVAAIVRRMEGASGLAPQAPGSEPGVT